METQFGWSYWFACSFGSIVAFAFMGKLEAGIAIAVLTMIFGAVWIGYDKRSKR